MNTRQGMLVTLFSATLFINFASSFWTMWSVATVSLFMLMVTDFMFFTVCSPARRLAALAEGGRARGGRMDAHTWTHTPCPTARQLRWPVPRCGAFSPSPPPFDLYASHRCASPLQDDEFWPAA
jgi:hypothetical protein